MKETFKLKITGLLIFLMICLSGKAQNGKLPPFIITQQNGKYFKATQLPYDKGILIIYFSPECEDCHAFISALKKRINKFSHTSIVMVTQAPLNEMKSFITQYQLNQFNNIHVGTEETTLFLGQYYKLDKLPFIALYDKMGNLQATYRQSINLDQFISRHSTIL